MKIELTIAEAKALIDLIKGGATLNEVKQVINQPESTEIKIGEQIWTNKNLKVDHFRNGEPIPLIKNKNEWRELTTAAYCISPSGEYLYNWYAVNDPRGLAPEGWHVPTDEEWTKLTDFLGGESIAGKQMKSSPSDSLNWNGNNSSGFSGLPGGYRDTNGNFYNAGDNGYWWSSSPNFSNAWSRKLYSYNDNVNRDYNNQRYGFSVRCVKN